MRHASTSATALPLLLLAAVAALAAAPGGSASDQREAGPYAARPWFPELHFLWRHRHAEQRYRATPYERPPGWFYRRWTVGQVLPPLFRTPAYWIRDFWMFDLGVPPEGAVWVRYNDDALLVRERSGRIVDVVYDLFY